MDSLANTIGFTNLTDEQRQQAESLALETITNNVFASLEDRLSADQLSEVDQLLQQKQNEQVAIKLQEWAGIDLDSLLDEEAERYGQEISLAAALMRDPGDDGS